MRRHHGDSGTEPATRPLRALHLASAHTRLFSVAPKQTRLHRPEAARHFRLRVDHAKPDRLMLTRMFSDVPRPGQIRLARHVDIAARADGDRSSAGPEGAGVAALRTGEELLCRAPALNEGGGSSAPHFAAEQAELGTLPQLLEHAAWPAQRATLCTFHQALIRMPMRKAASCL